MLLISFRSSQGDARLGLVEGDAVHDLTAAVPVACADFASLLAVAAAAGSTPLAFLRRLLAGRTAPLAGRYADLDVAPAPRLLLPFTPPEVWAAGVTYLRSRDAREQESHGATIYDKVYTAPRPEVFFKATGWRVRAPGAALGLRADSHWLVPEPELALVLDGRGGCIGYTVGNDLSCRDIEGENPLYLPQAKIWRGACSLGPAVLLADSALDFPICMTIRRGGAVVFSGETHTNQMKRRYAELIACLHAENEVLPGTVLLTGAGIVPPDDFTLQAGDVVEIAVPGIGVLRNPCRPAAELGGVRG